MSYFVGSELLILIKVDVIREQPLPHLQVLLAHIPQAHLDQQKP
ncbi:hypothetical protein [Vibrio mediterranei]|jgi:hypothetical protein|nr:hypothetical protein [Vibrio mediterranei]MCY9856075.1 hypothetical protein [Vibrio mediterranei]